MGRTSSGPKNGHFRPLALVIRTRDNKQMTRVKTLISHMVRSLINRLEQWCSDISTLPDIAGASYTG